MLITTHLNSNTGYIFISNGTKGLQLMVRFYICIISIYAFFLNLALDLDHADRFVCPHICIKILASNLVK